MIKLKTCPRKLGGCGRRKALALFRKNKGRSVKTDDGHDVICRTCRLSLEKTRDWSRHVGVDPLYRKSVTAREMLNLYK